MKKSSYVFLGIGILIIIAIALAFTNKGTTGNATGSENMPYYAKLSPAIKEAYSFAADNPDALNGVNCYCGCMQHVHDGRIHKRGLLDCFKKEDGNFEKHASDCDMCIKDALQVKQMTEKGIDKEAIKKAIDSKYSSLPKH